MSDSVVVAAPLSLQVSIDGVWSANDLSIFFRNIDDLYNLLIVLETRSLNNAERQRDLVPVDRRRLRNFVTVELRQPPLAITSIRYASPGAAILAGVAVAVTALSQLLNSLAQFSENKQQAGKLDIEAKQLELDQAIDRQRYLTARTPVTDGISDARALAETRSMDLDNQLKSEQLRTLRLDNLRNELELIRDVQRLSLDNDLSPEKARRVRGWAESRIEPLELLADSGKITAAGTTSRQDKENGREA